MNSLCWLRMPRDNIYENLTNHCTKENRNIGELASKHLLVKLLEFSFDIGYVRNHYALFKFLHIVYSFQKNTSGTKQECHTFS